MYPIDYYLNVEYSDDFDVTFNKKLFFQEIIKAHLNIHSHITNYIYSQTYQHLFDKIAINLYPNLILTPDIIKLKLSDNYKLSKDELLIAIKKLYVPIFLHEDKLLSLMFYLYLDIKISLFNTTNNHYDNIISEINQILDDMIVVENSNLDIKNKIMIQHKKYVGYLYVIFDSVFNNSILKLIKHNDIISDQYNKSINELVIKFNKWFNLI